MGKAERYGNIDMLGYKIFASDMNSCLEKVFSMKKVHIVSGNPEVLYVGLNNKELFKNFISDKSVIIPDGVGVQISAKILKTPVKEKIAGIELMKKILEKCEKTGESIYLLGASEENLNISSLFFSYLTLLSIGINTVDIASPTIVKTVSGTDTAAL